MPSNVGVVEEESGAGGEPEVGGGGGSGAGLPRGGGAGEGGVQEEVGEERLFEAKEVLQKVPKSLVWNFLR